MLSARDALERLREGNRRFVTGARSSDSRTAPERRAELIAEQRPFAAVLACSDSRVPVEIVFDQGLGDLFVVRVAGNVAGPSQIGSIEFAVEQLGARLVVVLGHTQCGAVLAALDQVRGGAAKLSPNLSVVVERITPAVDRLLATELRGDRQALVRQAVRANVRAAADRLRQGSDVLARHLREEGLLVVGAEYDLETGVVDFFKQVPPAS